MSMFPSCSKQLWQESLWQTSWLWGFPPVLCQNFMCFSNTHYCCMTLLSVFPVFIWVPFPPKINIFFLRVVTVVAKSLICSLLYLAENHIKLQCHINVYLVSPGGFVEELFPGYQVCGRNISGLPVSLPLLSYPLYTFLDIICLLWGALYLTVYYRWIYCSILQTIFQIA